jgi:ribosome biogenesis SPOUT family RNA methylase Rps3
MKNIFVIEHLEPELYDWCLIEYKHMSKIVGKDYLWFTNILPKDIDKLKNYGKVFIESVKSMQLSKTCVLDMESDIELKTEDKNKFNYFIFGGILGDNPPRKRTNPELTQFIKNAEVRNIGKAQFSTDNAVYVVKKILDGTPLNKIPFQDKVEIRINSIESTILPYRYPLVKGKPNISKELIKYITKDNKI